MEGMDVKGGATPRVADDGFQPSVAQVALPTAVLSTDFPQHFIANQLSTLSNRAIPIVIPTSGGVTPNQPHFECNPIAEQQILNVPTNVGNIISEKVATYRHPLFPLLRILFEKCEMATNSIENVNSTSFDHEIKSFIMQMAKENKPFFTDDEEVDGLMLKSLQVLRIHLLELEKVNELCKDFCTRYISCLKEKLNSENIMQSLDITTSPPGSPVATETDNSQPKPTKQRKSVDQKQPTPIPVPSPSSSSQTPIEPVEQNNNIPIAELTSGFLSKKSKCGKRVVLPKQATYVLKAWLFQHLVHPYPTEDEKRELALKTNLSNLQVNNWFINARRRILQPMLDSSTPFLKNNKRSKHKNAAQKDWTNSIGVYNAYRTEALQQQVSQMNFIPQPTALLVSLPDRSTAQSVVISQPLQFVTQVPIQAIAPNGFIPISQPAVSLASNEHKVASDAQSVTQ